MFERKIKKDYLNLSKIVYGGEFYFELKNYKLKELTNSGFQKCADSLLSQKGNYDFYSYKNEETGFCANVFEGKNHLVIAYRGTERLGLGENVSDINAFIKDVTTDYNLMSANEDKQFKNAWDFYKEVKKQNPAKKIVIVGQSLGGALAQIVAAKEYTLNRKKIETYTFNAPGCSHLLELYDCNPNFNYSFITNYSVMNDWCGMFGEHVGKRFLIAPIEIPETKTNSTAEMINNTLLSTHEGIFDYDETTHGKVMKKPKDFNQQEGLSLWYFDKNNPLKDYANLSDYIKQNFIQFDLTQNTFAQNELIQKTGQFLKENIPDEVQNSTVATAIKNATDNLITSSNEQMEKLLETFNNNNILSAIKMLDAVFSQLTQTSLDKAKMFVN